jgi:methyltransferase (TIGR00027 family)
MKEGKASRTADLAAVLRATESMKRADKRVCDDPYAKDFLSGIYSVGLKSRLLTKIALWYTELKSPGGIGHIVARTKHYDDYLKTCIEDGIEQLVILGAGYDSRAYRFDELKGRVKVFEVDHPTTQRVKKEKVRKIFGSFPDHVVYVPIDFDKEKLEEKLLESGYDENLKTLFMWEGVVMYLTAEAVDETLDFVANNSGEGSSIVFDYILQSVMDGTCEFEEAEKWRKQVERRGEAPSFGIKEGAVAEFLSERGFYQVKDVNYQFLENTYLKPKGSNRKVSRHYGYVHATVKPRDTLG